MKIYDEDTIKGEKKGKRRENIKMYNKLKSKKAHLSLKGSPREAMTVDWQKGETMSKVFRTKK